MNKSISTKIFAYFMGVIILVLAIIWFGIKFYIKDYYYGEKILNMQQTIEDINILFREKGYVPSVLEDLEYIGYQFGGKISLYDGNNVLTIINKNVDYHQGRIVDEIQFRNVVAYILETDYPVKGTKWLIYGEALEDDKLAVLEIPIESIESTLLFVGKFFGYLVWISIVIAGVFSVFLSKSISRPVAQINEIAKEMGRLNFNVKYLGTRSDEIGQLGITLNEISGHLENTIEKLQLELEKEKQLDILRKSFVAQVSHELQTPLTVINGYIEALEDGMADTEEERKRYYDIIEDEASKISKMVRELLDLSQLEAGTFKMQKEEVLLQELLEDISEKYKRIAVSKGIIWNFKSDLSEEILELDPIRIEQAISNIIGNAFKHTIEGGNIWFAAEKNEQAIYLSIENEGEGILAEDLDYIWESFYKGKNKTEKNGTGLGLAIAANIFKYHKIEYRAFNTDKGVAFELAFPK